MTAGMTYRSALEVSAEAQAELVTEAFSDDFIGPVMFDSVEAFGEFVRLQGIDLGMSRLALSDGRLIAFAYIGNLGDVLRVCGMGVIPAHRRRGVGGKLLSRIIEEAKNRGIRLLTLEVIGRNEAALGLYRRAGLEIAGKLMGYRLPADAPSEMPSGDDGEGVEEIDLHEASRLLCAVNGPLWPYQLSGWGVQKCHPRDAAAWRYGSSIVVHTRPTVKTPVRIKAFADMDGNDGQLLRLIACLRQRFGPCPWQVGAVVPEHVGANLFLPLGFEEDDVFQWQMTSRLADL